jgi:hypothetical protein
MIWEEEVHKLAAGVHESRNANVFHFGLLDINEKPLENCLKQRFKISAGSLVVDTPRD